MISWEEEVIEMAQLATDRLARVNVAIKVALQEAAQAGPLDAETERIIRTTIFLETE